MISKKIYLLILSFLVCIALVTFFQSINTSNTEQFETLRQILQTQEITEEPISNVRKPVYVLKQNNYTGNLPELYLKDRPKKPKGFNNTCAKFPDVFTLQFKNNYWQMQETSNGTLYLFNAYLDERTSNKTIRIVGMLDVYMPKTKFYCQFWYANSNVPKVVMSEIPFWVFRHGWGADKNNLIHPYIITCPLMTFKNQTPISVSLVGKPCTHPTNNLKIFYKTVEKKKNFVVCVKGLSFPFEDKTTRLVEWIELLKILGADKINFYEFSVHPKVQKLLDYYINEGLVELTPITIIGDVSNSPYLQNQYLRKKVIQRRLQEVVPYNDCLYKHLQEFKYVVLLDTDEVIVPSEGNWIKLLEDLQKLFPKVSTFLARNVYFIDNYLHQHDWFAGIPKYMHMLQHVWRTKNYTKPGFFVKGFHNTSQVFALHNHFPIGCLKSCSNKEIDVKLAHLQHYRADCAAGVSNCKIMKENSVVDTRLWNFKDELIRKVEEVLENLEFIYR